MADPLSVIASVIGVGTFAARSAKALYDLVSTIINASTEIKGISDDVRGLHAILLSLKSHLQEEDIQVVIREDKVMLEMLTNLKDPLASCSNALEQLRLKLKSHLKLSGDRKSSKFSNIDVKWWFTKGTLKDLLDRLGRNKDTLNVALAAISAYCSIRLHAVSYNQYQNLELTALTSTDPVPTKSRRLRKSNDTDAGSALREYVDQVTSLKSKTLLSSALEPPNSIVAATLNETQADHLNLQTTSNPESNLQRLQKLENQRIGIHLAAKEGNDLVVEILLDEGAYIDAKDVDGKTALHVAALWGNEAVVRTLLKYGADVEAKTIPRGTSHEIRHFGGRTPLHYAAANGYEPTVRLLLDCKADIGAANTSQRTPLQEAILHGHTAIARTLIELGAPLNHRNSDGWTALHEAAQHGNHEITKLLLDRGADPEPITADTEIYTEWDRGRTPLHIVADNGNSLVLQGLLTKGVNIEARTENDYTALHIAALFGHQVFVRKLLEAGAKTDPRNTQCEDTALHKAALKGHIAVIRVLLQHGADARAINILGRTPAQHARACRHEEAAQRIEEYTADTGG